MAYKPKVLEVAAGGTGATTLTSRGVLIGQGSSPIAATAAGTAGQVLRSGGAGADPAYSTATYPATATGTGTILRADGTNWTATTTTYPNTNAINTVLYASSANVMSALATANNGVLNTSGTGVPSITATPTVTSIAFTADNQALSRYNVGTYVPTLTGQTTAPTVTYSQQLGFYTVIGNRVHVDVLLSLATLSGGSGNVLISLPFAVASGYEAVGACYVENCTFVGDLCFRGVSASTNGQIMISVTTLAVAVMQISALTATFHITASINYRY